MTTRAFALAVALLCSVVALSSTALAQPGHEGHDHDKPTAALERPAPTLAAAPTAAAPAEAAAEAKSAGAPAMGTNTNAKALVFWFFALACVVGAIFVITRRNLVSAVMGLVGTFFAIAAVYVMLYAHFIAAIQVLVYAGAIMVLFVFVVMILNREEDEPWAMQGLFGKGVAAIALVYLFARVGQVLWRVKAAAPAVLEPVGQHAHDFGSTRALGDTLFRGYLFPFEAVSILLLIAVVGALAVARPKELQEAQESQP